MLLYKTPIIFFFLSVGLFLCGLWFLNTSKNKKVHQSKAGFLISYTYFFFSLLNITIAAGVLIHNIYYPFDLFWLLFIHNFILVLLSLMSIYTVYYIFFPKKNVFPLVICSSLGVILMIETIIFRPIPFINHLGNIDWNLNLFLSINVFYLLLISIGSFFYIFWRLLSLSKEKYLKRVYSFNCGIAAFGILGVFIRFITPHFEKNSIILIIADSIVALIGIVLIILLFAIPLISNLRNK